jgi:uncharacterized protein (TIGR02145 family)
MTDPEAGALLDLNSTAKGVLLLSNVSLDDLEKIPGGVFVGIANEQDENSGLTGAVVYNTNTATGPGIYVWTGTKWTTFKLDDGNVDPTVPGGVGTLKDSRDGETYLTGYFGTTAGIWMLENLRYVPKTGEGYMDRGLSSTQLEDKYYAYPGANGSYNPGTADAGWDKSWGILYNWAGATNGENGLTFDQGEMAYDGIYIKVQGICPKGWYLPSDKDWNDLEKVIGESIGVYSTSGGADWYDSYRIVDGSFRGTYGKKMKSTTQIGGNPSNGTSKPAEDGGFDVLLVGSVSGNNRYFGESTSFWSSSFGGTTKAWFRGLIFDNEGMIRINEARSGLFSVRCKKD